MLKTLYIDAAAPVVVAAGQSIIVTDISISFVTGLAISPMVAEIFEADGLTKICKVQSAGLFTSSFSFEMANHTFQLTTPFLAPRGISIILYSAGNATLTISYMNVGA